MGGDVAGRRRICLVTCRELRGLIPEDERLRDALRRSGWNVAVAAWDDSRQRWADYDAVVLRSSWDYHRRAGEFRAWIDACAATGVPLWNPAPALLWNMHKSYLLDLEARGVAVVSTELVPRGAVPALDELLQRRGWDEAVVKPAISATAWRTFRTRSGDAAADQRRFAELVDEGDTLVQPFVAEVALAGEISFLYFGGRYSHAVLKQAADGDFRVQEEFGGRAAPTRPGSELLAEAARVAAAIPHPWLYARIDGAVRGGRLLVMEVELIEPQLFLGLEPAAAPRLAAELGSRVPAARTRS